VAHAAMTLEEPLDVGSKAPAMGPRPVTDPPPEKPLDRVERLGRLYDLLLLVEREHTSHTGALVFHRGTRALGRVVMSGGRLCFVSATPVHRRLGDILSERHPEGAEVLKQALVRVAGGQLLGEALLDVGSAPLELIRSCLREQAVIGLSSLAVYPEALEMSHLTLDGAFDARLTFTLLDVYRAAVAAEPPGYDDPVGEMFARFSGDAEVAALFDHRAGGGLLPIALTGVDAIALSDLLEIARLVRQTAHPPTLRAAGVVPRVLAAGTPDWTCVFIVSAGRSLMLGGVTASRKARILSGVFEAGSRGDTWHPPS